MDFVLQLTGKAGGGDLDLGDIQLLQVFADLEGKYHEQNAVVVHREPCSATLATPLGVDLAPVQSMAFEAGNDDRVLLDLEWPDEGDPLFEDHQSAWSHAHVDKAFGIPGESITDSSGIPMQNSRRLVPLVHLREQGLQRSSARDHLLRTHRGYCGGSSAPSMAAGWTRSS
jgi:hypothetical protein